MLRRNASQRLHTTEDVFQSLASITNGLSFVAMQVVRDVCDDAMRGNSQHDSPRDTRTGRCRVLKAELIDAAEENLRCIESESRGVMLKGPRHAWGAGDLALTISQHKHAGREGQAQGPAACLLRDSAVVDERRVRRW